MNASALRPNLPAPSPDERSVMYSRLPLITCEEMPEARAVCMIAIDVVADASTCAVACQNGVPDIGALESMLRMLHHLCGLIESDIARAKLLTGKGAPS